MVTLGILLIAFWKLKLRKAVLLMVFTPNSSIVKIWVSLVLAGTYQREDVPKLYNLQEVVWGILDSLV